jgi:hypothetical protein
VQDAGAVDAVRQQKRGDIDVGAAVVDADEGGGGPRGVAAVDEQQGVADVEVPALGLHQAVLVVAGHRGGLAELFTEDCQAEIYRRQIEIVDRASYVRGFCPWLLYDFRTERRQTRFQQGWNRKGLIVEDKATKKLAFDVLARHYHALLNA